MNDIEYHPTAQVKMLEHVAEVAAEEVDRLHHAVEMLTRQNAKIEAQRDALKDALKKLLDRYVGLHVEFGRRITEMEAHIDQMSQQITTLNMDATLGRD